MLNGQSKNRRIGLYGGSFNPPHVGHLIVADAVRDQFDLDEIWWIPSDTPPHKAAPEVAPTADRVELTRRAIADNDHFKLCLVEVERGGVSYTIDTVTALQERYPEVEFSLIMGSDSLAGFPNWHKPEEIASRLPLLVYKRPGGQSPELPDSLQADVSFVEAPLIDISGTDIRRRCRQGFSIRYLVPQGVRHYLKEHQLYLDRQETSS